MKTTKTITALFAICLAFSPLAEDADIGERFYLGVGGAQFQSRHYDGVSCDRCTTDRSRGGVIFYGGYRGNEHFGAEIGASFVNGFGVVSTQDEGGAESRSKSEYRNVYAAGTARAPVFRNIVFLNAKLGAHYYKRNDINTGDTPPIAASGKQKGIRPIFGAGFEVQILRGGLRADWSRFFGEDGDGLDVIAVNYIYRF